MGVRQAETRKPGEPLTCSHVLSLRLSWVMAGPPAWTHERPRRRPPSQPKPSARLAAASTSGEPAAARTAYNIPRNPLSQGPTDFSLATDVQVLDTVGRPFDRPSPPLVGTYTPTQALRRLLVSSGFTYPFTEANTATLDTLSSILPHNCLTSEDSLVGVYVHDQIIVLKNLKLLGGVRFDYLAQDSSSTARSGGETMLCSQHDTAFSP